MENEIIEIHDSIVDGIYRLGSDIVLSFSDAYIHRSSGQAGVDPGTVWLRPATITFKNGILAGSSPDSPIRISDGTLEIEGQVSPNAIPIPFDHIGNVQLSLQFEDGTKVIVSGMSSILGLSGVEKYLEQFK